MDKLKCGMGPFVCGLMQLQTNGVMRGLLKGLWRPLDIINCPNLYYQLFFFLFKLYNSTWKSCVMIELILT